MSSRKLTEELNELILKSAFARLPQKPDSPIDRYIEHNLLNKTTLDEDMDLFIQEIIEPVVSMRKSMLDYLNMLHYFLIDTNPEDWTANSKVTELQIFALDLYDQIKNKIHISDHLESEVISAYPDLDKRNIQKITEKLRKFLNNDTAIELKLSHLAPYIYYEYYKVHKNPEEVQVLFYNTTNFYGLLKSLVYVVDNY